MLDHSTSASLQRELAERSDRGLALATFVPAKPDLVIRFFNGPTRTLRPTCCPPTGFHTVWRNRIAMVDLTSAPVLNPLKDPSGTVAALPRYGGPVVEIDTRGAVIARSRLLFRPGPVSLAPDGEHFAIISAPLGPYDRRAGAYIAGFHDDDARNLNVTFAGSRDSPSDRHGSAEQTSTDWSPQGGRLLLSYLGAVSLVDVRTGQSKKLVEGGGAMWSPSGDWISYMTPKSEVALLNPSTGVSKLIDPGKEMLWPPKWSPDGKYLLVPEGRGSHVVDGCLWVYRISDGAWAPVPDSGALLAEWYWIEMGPTEEAK
jgi:hypothetical protein